MRILVCTLVALVGCHGGDGDDYYVEPGGGIGAGGNGNGSLPDAATGDGAATIHGQICGLTDFRDWGLCTMTGFDGYMVELDTGMSTANGSGMFSIPYPTGTGAVWSVASADTSATPTLMPYAADTTVFSFKTNAYQDLAGNLGVNIDGGAVFVRVRDTATGMPLDGVTASVTPAQTNGAGPMYDATGPANTFDPGTQSGDLGVIWLPNVPASTAATVTLTPPVAVGGPKTLVIPVVAQAATFATVNFP